VAPRPPAKKDKLPEPEVVSLQTQDGLSIRATWYAGTAKKESVPLIMVHGWGGQRGEFDSLALHLQGLGHSVIAPDLRGHGESRVLRPGASSKSDAPNLTPREMEAMVWDVEACKSFLMDKNNAGECNIASLCVVGAEFGGIIAMRWALIDWSWPQLPAYQQGQDVKAAVLLTPLQTFKGVTMQPALRHPLVRSRLSLLIVAGKEDPKGTSEAKRLLSGLESFHYKPTGNRDLDEGQIDLILSQPATKVQGTELLARGLPTQQEIAAFIKRRLVDRMSEPELRWTDRKGPSDN
jgi:pimeloyl-ACP methyl ester carboxylesterase